MNSFEKIIDFHSAALQSPVAKKPAADDRLDRSLYRREDRPIRIFTLGYFQVEIDGLSINSQGRGKKKPMELLKALIAFGGIEVPMEKISEALWPHSEGDSAQQAFDTNLYRLRRYLGTAKALLLREGRLSINTNLCWMDCWEFEITQSRIEKEIFSQNPSIPQLLLWVYQLSDIYPAHFLQSDMDNYWLIGYRQRLQSKFYRIVNQIGACLEMEAEYSRALELYLRALEIDGYMETFCQKAMTCYKQLGLHAEGIVLYNRCSHYLKKNLQMNPSSTTEAIRQSLLHSLH